MRHRAILALFPLLTACQQPAPAAPPPSEAKGPSPFAGEFDARGTEPFWALKIRGETLTLSRPDRSDVSVASSGPSIEGDTAVWNATLGGDALIVTLSEPAGACSDGMSDLSYPYEAQVVVGSEILKGCAFETQRPPPGPRP